MADEEGSGYKGQLGAGVMGAANDGRDGDHHGCAEGCGHGEDDEVSCGFGALCATFGDAGPEGESAGQGA
jgi:hypothetical protein